MAKKHKRFPAKLAFMLNNPLRRHFAPPEKLISKFAVSPSDVVVDFGCGPGYFTIPIAKISRRTIGVDVSSVMLDKARTRSIKEGVQIELMQSDGTRIDLPDSNVDLIILVHVFHEIENQRKVLTEFLRILKPEGRVVIVEKTGGNSFLAERFGPPIVNSNEIMQEITAAGFAKVTTIAHGNDSVIHGRRT